MDAARDVTQGGVAEGRGAKVQVRALDEGEEFRSAEEIREDISVTSQALHDRIDELRGRLRHRFGSFSDPLHIRERVQQRPLAWCGVALVVGLALGARRGFRGPVVALRGVGRASSGVVRGVSHTVGTQLTASLLNRFLGGRR